MKIVRFNSKGNCQFVYFNWRKLRFETTCWAKGLDALFGMTKGSKHVIVGLWNY